MDWNNLLSTKRLSSNPHGPPGSDDHRGAFERDWDRIIFSTAFRRMHDKTQVFPLPDNDVVHSRMTHSLEVASVGRSLGSMAARLVGLQADAAQDISQIVAAACLAHDIGNPPFGHAGEDAVRRFFAKASVQGLSVREETDLLNYEGNAQGLRILTRLQFEEYGGMRLTAATLGAFVKYPRESGDDFDSSYAGSKKFGVFQSEVGLVEQLAEELELPGFNGDKDGRGWRRHPLAYLVEAADDICNAILDLEDACRLGWLSHEVLDTELRLIAGPKYVESTFKLFPDPRDATGYLRALAIGSLIEEVAPLFKSHSEEIFEGKSVKPLVKLSARHDVLTKLGSLATEYCYENPRVLEREAAGYAAIQGLLERFIPAVIDSNHPKGSLEDRMAKLINQRARLSKTSQENTYERGLRVLDYLSGMTDSYAIESFRHLSGVTT